MGFWSYKVYKPLSVSLQLLLGFAVSWKSAEHTYWIRIIMSKPRSSSTRKSHVRRFSGEVGEDGLRHWSCSLPPNQDAIRKSQIGSPLSANENCYDEVFHDSTSSGYCSTSANRSRAATYNTTRKETLAHELQSNYAVFEESDGIIPSPISSVLTKQNIDVADSALAEALQA